MSGQSCRLKAGAELGVDRPPGPVGSNKEIVGGAVGKGDDMQARSEIQFKVGDKAVYPAQGVAEVVNIEEKDIAGNRQRFYVLRILDTDRKIMVPVSNASAVGLRQVIS